MKAKFVLLFLLSFLLLGSLKAVTLPSGIVAYVPITIQNTQTTATPNPFQQMIRVNVSKYSSYMVYNGSFANFEFFYENGTIIPAWIESYSAPILTIWLKLTSIPASSSLTIYLGFASKTTNLLSSSGTSGIGEAPQLSPTYAQYDNGASVFNIYADFSGTALPSGWTAVSGTSGTDYVINNGLQLKTTYTRIQGPSVTQNFVLEGYFQFISNANNGWDFGVYSSSTSAYGLHARGTNWATTWYYNNGYTQISSSGSTIGSGYYFIWQLINKAGSITTNFDNPSYTVLYTASFTNSLSGAPITLGKCFDNYYAGETLNVIFYWIRTRAYPPNGVMPSVSFGSVQIVNPTISISPPPPYTYPNPTITITATTLNSGDSLVLYFQKTQVASGTTSITYTINQVLAVGTYNVTVVDTTTGGRTEQYFNVTKAWIKITITNSTNSIYTTNYSNTFIATYTTTNIALAIQQNLQFNLYVQSNLVNSTTAANSLKTKINSIGTWTIQASVVGNQNFSSNTTTITYLIHVPVWFLNLTSSGNQITSDIFLVSNTGINTYLPFQIKANQVSGVTYDLWLYKGGSWNLNLTNVANFTYISPVPFNISPAPSAFAVVEKTTQNSIKANKTITTIATAINIANLTQRIQYYPTIFQIGTIPKAQQVGLWSYYNGKPSKLILSSVGSNQTTFSTDVLNPSGIVTLVYPFVSFNVSVSLGSFSPFNLVNTSSGYLSRQILNITSFFQHNFSYTPTNFTIDLNVFVNGYNTQPISVKASNVASFLVFAPNSVNNPSLTLYNITLFLSKSPTSRYYAQQNNFCNLIIQSTPAKFFVGILDSNILPTQYFTVQIYNQSQTFGYANLNGYYFITTILAGQSKQVNIFKMTSIPFTVPLYVGKPYSFSILDPSCNNVYTSPFNTWSNPIQIIYKYTTTNTTNLNPYEWLSKINFYCSINNNFTTNTSKVVCNFTSPSALQFSLLLYNETPLQNILVCNSSTISASGIVNCTATTIQHNRYIVQFMVKYGNKWYLVWRDFVGKANIMFREYGVFIAIIGLVLIIIASIANVNFGIIVALIYVTLLDYIRIIDFGGMTIYLWIPGVILLWVLNRR